MKRWSSTLLSGFLLAVGALTGTAQQQPVISVEITAITVYDGGELDSIEVLVGGDGYVTAPAVRIASPGGSGRTAQATASIDRRITSIRLLSGGTGYPTNTTVQITGGGGTGASAVAEVEDGEIVSVSIINGGSGYSSDPQITFVGGGSGASAVALMSGYVSSINVTDPGSGYVAVPTITLEGGGGSGATVFGALTGTYYSPPNERSGPAGTTIGITARALGTFMRDSFRYSFFVNGISIGRTPDPVPPPNDCTIPWTPPQPGFYFLTVEADDGTNKAMSLPVRFFAGGTVVNSPMTNTIVPNGSSVVLKADSTVGGGFIRSIQFFDNGIPIGEPDSTIPYSLIYTPPGGPGTVHNITAVATDNDFTLLPASPPVRLNVVNSIAPLPRSTITTPSHNSAVTIPTAVDGNIPIVVDATSSSGVVSKVELYIDGVLFGTSSNYPYTFNWKPKVVGVYRLVALTYDDKNNVVASTTSAGPTSTPRPTLVTVETQTSELIVTAKVYRGNYTTIGATGVSTTLPSVAFHRDGSGDAVMIGFSGGASPAIHYVENIPVAGDGSFAVYDGATTVAAGQISATGASGNFDSNRATFIAPLVTGSSAYQGSGRLTGSIAGKANSLFTGIIAPDGGLTIYVRDGTNEDAGFGLVRSTGAFEFPTVRGGTFKGQIGTDGGLLTGTLERGPVTGQVAATFVSSAAASSDGFLMNLATRGPVGTGDKQLIAGFVVAGDSPKQVLVRGVGPTLTSFGVAGAVAEPSLTLFDADRRQIAFNKQWNGNPSVKAASAHAGAFALSDSSRDSSLIQTLAPGAYSVQMSSNGSPGVGLIEIYDLDLLDAYSAKRVLNVSTRGEVGSGDKIIIAGLTISGTRPKRVLVRGVGPTLGTFGVPGAVADPVVRLFQGQTMLRENDNWEIGNDPAAVRTLSAKVGAFALPNGSKDAVLLITLPPGSYTAQVSGMNGSTGIALVEVYEVD